LEKKGVRVLGVAESFKKGAGERAVLAGVVMRADFVIDGVVVGECTVGGLDSTEGIIRMYHTLGREDVMAIMLNGCIISWFNVIDLHRLHDETRLPVIAVSYNPTRGILNFFKKYFPDDWQKRVEIYERNGPRIGIVNKNNLTIYIRSVGIDEEDAARLINRFTLFGKIPEPLRIAKLVAHAILLSRVKGV